MGWGTVLVCLGERLLFLPGWAGFLGQVCSLQSVVWRAAAHSADVSEGWQIESCKDKLSNKIPSSLQPPTPLTPTSL